MNKKRILIICGIVVAIVVIMAIAPYYKQVPVVVVVDRDVREMALNWKEDTVNLVMDSEFKNHNYKILDILEFDSSSSQSISLGDGELVENMKEDLAKKVPGNKEIVILFTRNLPGDFLTFEKNGNYYIIMTYSFWGKNLDKNLFPDDKEREAYAKLERMLYENIIHGVLNEGVYVLNQ